MAKNGLPLVPRRYVAPRAWGGREGFSLLETFLALLLTVLIVLAVYNLFGSQEKSHAVVDQMAEMNQNLRVAMLWVTRDLRMAGFQIANGTTTSGIGVLNGVTVTDGAGAAPDALTVIYAQGDTQTELDFLTMPTPGATIQVADASGFSVGNLILITTGLSTSLFQITGIVGGGTLQHDTGLTPDLNDPAGHNPFPGYGLGNRVFKARRRQYTVDTTNPNHPVLRVSEDWRAPTIVADYIQNLQITLPDGSAPAANSGAYLVSITARTGKPLTGMGGIQTKTMSQVVNVRNLP